jgi:hypothetical protein
MTRCRACARSKRGAEEPAAMESCVTVSAKQAACAPSYCARPDGAALWLFGSSSADAAAADCLAPAYVLPQLPRPNATEQMEA